MHDFVVVGAGPAGSRFATKAAQAGYDVIVFEQGEIGKPLACSGHVSLDIWEFVPDSATSRLFQNDIYGARFHVAGAGSKAYPFYKNEPVSNAIDRVELDKVLAETARDHGAVIKDHHTVTRVEETEENVHVTVRAGGETFTVQSRMVAGCDGPRSRVRRELDLPAPDEQLHGVLGFDETPDDDDFVDVHLTVPGFFAWRIPRGDAGVEYGLAATPDDTVSRRFDSLTADYGASITNRCSGGIPIGAPDRITTPRGFLIGDAAGQTKPFTGGGILYGMTAADLAAETINPHRSSTTASYESAWRNELLNEQRLGHLIRNAYSLPKPIQQLGLRVFSGEIGVHMDRPTSVFSRKQLRALFAR